MPLINPTTTISLQFKPTKKMDNGLYTDPGFTFDLTKEKLFNKNPTNKDSKYTTSNPGAIGNQFLPKIKGNNSTFNLTEEKLFNFNPTNSQVLLKYTTSKPGAISNQFLPKIKGNNSTFNLTEENLLNFNPTNSEVDLKYTTSKPGAIGNQFKPTRTMDSKLHTDPGFTFNLTEELLSNFNPTNSEVLLKYTTSSPGAIGNQFIPELDLTKVNLKTFDLVKEQLIKLNPTNPDVDLKYTATSQLAISNQFIPKDSPSNILLLKNPTNPPEKKSNWLDIFSLALHTDTQRQFWPMYYGTGDEQLDRELKQAATDAASILTNKALDLLPDDGAIMGAVNYLSQYVFRGDTIMVKPPMIASWNELTAGKDSIKNILNDGRDLIKFFFTGPNVTPYSPKAQDDVMQFRAYITSLSDTHNPNWTAQQMVGRADPNYHYTGYSRDLSLDFTVYASSRLEMKPIWKKLNMLAGYTAPSYGEVAPVGPWMRITIGDLFVQQPAIISSLSYTLIDSDTTWEINLKNRDNMCELPHKVSVSIGFHLITDYLPQQGGQFYTLNTGRASNAKNYWVSPAYKQAENKPIIRKRTTAVLAEEVKQNYVTEDGREYKSSKELDYELKNKKKEN